MTTEQIWLSIGLLGQLFFSCRFVVQWLTSEKMKKSVIPIAFWYLSIAGSVTLLSYAIHRMDPVFILGQSGGLIIYVRNLILIYRENLTGVSKDNEIMADTRQ